MPHKQYFSVKGDRQVSPASLSTNHVLHSCSVHIIYSFHMFKLCSRIIKPVLSMFSVKYMTTLSMCHLICRFENRQTNISNQCPIRVRTRDLLITNGPFAERLNLIYSATRTKQVIIANTNYSRRYPDMRLCGRRIGGFDLSTPGIASRVAAVGGDFVTIAPAGVIKMKRTKLLRFLRYI